MSEQDWGDLDALPASSSGAPRWLWFCGTGCLVVVLSVIAAGWGAVSWYKSGAGGEERLERLDSVLEYDEVPDGYELKFAQSVPFSDIEFFLFTEYGFGEAPGRRRTESSDGESDDDEDSESADGRSTQGGPETLFVVLMYVPEDEDTEQSGLVVDSDEAETFPIRIQGRDLVAVRVEDAWESESWGMGMAPQPSIAVEITEDGSDGRLFLFAGRERSREEVSEEEIAKFLEPFHVGPER